MAPAQLHETILLLQAAQGGDAAAVDALFARYVDRVRHIVALRIGKRASDIADIDDVVQDTLLDAYSALDRFTMKSEGALIHWLATLVEHNLRDRWRSAHAQKRGGGRVRPMAALSTTFLASSIFVGTEPSPSDWAAQRELEERLSAALLAMPERQRRVIEMRRLCGLSFEEIAQELELSGESSARSLFSRAMGALSAQI